MPGRNWSRGAAAVLLSCLLGSCAAAMERSQVSRRFSTIFGCQRPSVHSASGGYVAEGCGVVAHFTCFSGDDDMLFRSGSPGAILSVLLGRGGGRDTCVLERSTRTARTNPALPVPVARKASAGGVALKTRLLFSGGHLLAVGKPSLRPAHALLAVHTVRRLDPAPCTGRLFHDGMPLPIEELEREGDHEAQLVVRVDGLADVGRSIRFAGEVCGVEFDLDAAGREALGRFHARFNEELVRGGQPLARLGVSARARSPAQRRSTRPGRRAR